MKNRNSSPGTNVDGTLSNEATEPDFNKDQQTPSSKVIGKLKTIVLFPISLILSVLIWTVSLPIRFVQGIVYFIRMYSTPLLALLIVVGAAGGFIYISDDTDQLEEMSNYLQADRSFDEAEVERIFHEEINEVRAEHGAGALIYDDDLASIASDHSEDMKIRDYFAHVDPNGQDVMDRYHEYGYRCDAAGENIAETYVHERIEESSTGNTIRITDEEELAKQLVQQWMDSPGHRENILHSEWQRQGLGLYFSDDGKVYATQNFC
ncbi:CAP domain-containing protein [Natrialbaceae archaeon A-CW2]